MRQHGSGGLSKTFEFDELCKRELEGLKKASASKNGAQGRDRTTDTAIFSRMLYQLSYPGDRGA